MKPGSPSSPVEIGVRIREARLAQKMSQADLADKAGLTLSHIGLIERGQTDVKLQSFVRIIEALNISADSILCADVSAVREQLIEHYGEVLKSCTSSEIQTLLEITEKVKAAMHAYKTEE